MGHLREARRLGLMAIRDHGGHWASHHIERKDHLSRRPHHPCEWSFLFFAGPHFSVSPVLVQPARSLGLGRSSGILCRLPGLLPSGIIS